MATKETRRPVGRPRKSDPEPIPDTPQNIIRAVVRTRSKTEREKVGEGH